MTEATHTPGPKLLVTWNDFDSTERYWLDEDFTERGKKAAIRAAADKAKSIRRGFVSVIYERPGQAWGLIASFRTVDSRSKRDF